MPASKTKVLNNGRDVKYTGKAQKWFAKIPIFELLVHPAWRNLSKTATDMASLIIAKHDKAAAFGNKVDGRPVFSFTASEGQRMFEISRPTFTRAMKELVEKGFIEIHDPGGIQNGKGRAAQYMWSGGWKSWQAPPRDNRNILKARKMRNTEKNAIDDQNKIPYKER